LGNLSYVRTKEIPPSAPPVGQTGKNKTIESKLKGRKLGSPKTLPPKNQAKLKINKEATENHQLKLTEM
jgi:hypothetical protein